MDSKDSDWPDTGLVDLQLQHLYKSFGSLEVINDLSLTVYKGELCCLLGPSGCGKTTILKIIDGLLEPDRGTVWLAGQDITFLPPQRRNVGMVFQKPIYNSALENINSVFVFVSSIFSNCFCINFMPCITLSKEPLPP